MFEMKKQEEVPIVVEKQDNDDPDSLYYYSKDLKCKVPNSPSTEFGAYYVNYGKKKNNAGDIVCYDEYIDANVGINRDITSAWESCEKTMDKENISYINNINAYLDASINQLESEFDFTMKANEGYIFNTGFRLAVSDCIIPGHIADFQEIIDCAGLMLADGNYVNIFPSLRKMFNDYRKSPEDVEKYYDRLISLSPEIMISKVSESYHNIIINLLYKYNIIDVRKLIIKLGGNLVKEPSIELLYHLCFVKLLQLATNDINKIDELIRLNIYIYNTKINNTISYYDKYTDGRKNTEGGDPMIFGDF